MNELIMSLPWLIMIILWLTVIGYFFSLFSRFVKAIEKIANNFHK